MKKTIYTFRKTGAEFTLTKIDEETGRAVITDENGNHHLIGINTLKKNYKKTVIEIEEPKPELTKHQKEAIRNIHYGYIWTIGGLENDVQDGNIEALPPIEDMFEQVYSEVLNCTFGSGCCDSKGAPICMKFAGRQFIREQIAKEFTQEGYEVPEDLLKVPDNKTKEGHSNYKDGERVNLRKDEGDQLVTVRAFTGMVIGVFKIEKQTKNNITVKTAKGLLTFSKKDGKQINANNPKFANRIDVK